MTTAVSGEVIARYRTIGGATVDIYKDGSQAFESTCSSGCGHQRTWYFGWADLNTEPMALDKTRADAQGHAEKCRAMPTSRGWEHKLVVFHQPLRTEMNDLIDKLGAEGWELVSHTAPAQEYSQQWSFAFKRPLA